MRHSLLFCAALLILTSCTQEAPKRALTDESVEAYAATRGWVIDKRLEDHQKAQPISGLGYPRAKTLDDAWQYGREAWGLPRRASAKTFRHVARREGKPLDPYAATEMMDKVALASRQSALPPAKLLRAYWEERHLFDEAGFTFEQSIAIVAGMSQVEWEEWKMRRKLHQALTALSDPELHALLKSKGVALDINGTQRPMWDVLGDMDRLQCQHASGQAREKHWQTLSKGDLNSGLILMLDGQARKVACDLVGSLHCATGETHMKLSAVHKEAESVTEYQTTTSSGEAVAKGLFGKL